MLIALQRRGFYRRWAGRSERTPPPRPLSALVLLIFMLSLAGIPPLAGFAGKYHPELIETGHNELALFGALYIVPALYYYFRIVMHAYLKEPGNAPLPMITIGRRVGSRSCAS